MGNVPIVFQLNWTPDPTFTGVYVAADKTKNFFAQEGLSVTIQAGGFGIDPLAPIVSKKADFAVVGADKAAIAYANGAPIKVVAVEFQRNPVGWIVRSNKGVKSFHDLVGKKDIILGDKVGTETTAILSLILNRLNLVDRISAQGVGFELAYFFQNENVVYPVYLNEEPITARAKGFDIIEIDPALPENGSVHLYGNVIITHKDTISQNPQRITGFLNGLRKGWEFAKSDLKATESILRRYQEFNDEQMPAVLARSVNFVTSFYGVEVPPGHMEVSQWVNTLRVLRESGLLKKDVLVSDLVWFGGQN